MRSSLPPATSTDRISERTESQEGRDGVTSRLVALGSSTETCTLGTRAESHRAQAAVFWGLLAAPSHEEPRRDRIEGSEIPRE